VSNCSIPYKVKIKARPHYVKTLTFFPSVD